uniref:Hexosyltransferase n=1 Tax=Panagrolaimus davidi TaxID=227884 RepID=A0A914P5S6_9BILA
MLKERNLPLNIITKSSERNQRLKLFALYLLLFVGLVLLLLLFVNYSFPTLQNIYGLNNDFEVGAPLKTEGFVTPTSSLPPTTNASKQIWLDFCNLTDLDPWDSSIIKYIKPQKDHLLNCTRKVFEHSKLINGQLFIYSNESMNCQMRCLFSNGDRQIIYGIVNNVINGTKPECDVIEVECRLDGDNNEKEYPHYKYLHAQIYRNVSKLPPSSFPKPPEKYDVHIMILDSVSQTQFIRSLPKTIYMLRERYEAIPFEHLNKVGINSYPNGFAFLMGKMIKDIPVSPFSKGYFGDYKSKHEICKIPLDNEQFIGFRFKDDGYVTMMSEDWKNGVFMWPNCIGFKETPMDHYMKFV